MSHVDTIREIVAEHMTPEAPVARALTAAADALDADIRGLEAAVEQVEDLQDRVVKLEDEALPRDVEIP